MDSFFPTVDLEFLLNQIKSSGKLDSTFGIINVGTTYSVALSGSQPLYKRILLVRDIGNSQVYFEQAIAISYRFNFLSNLIEWLKVNRDWKDGGYIQNI